jgi:hypothetical protein
MSFISELEILKDENKKHHWDKYATLSAFLVNHADEIAKLVKVAEKRIGHYECDDSWYSCPKSDYGCADERQGTECNCGADEMIEALAKLNKEKS